MLLCRPYRAIIMLLSLFTGVPLRCTPAYALTAPMGLLLTYALAAPMGRMPTRAVVGCDGGEAR